MRRWALLALVAGAGVAWAQGAWSVDVEGRGAVLQPFALPAGVAAVDAALVVFCDADVPGGLNVNVWLGRPAGVAWPASFEAATRRDQDAVRRDRWSSDGDRLAAPYAYAEVGRILDDLRRGGSVALRAFVIDGVADAAQPTYQFAVDGFATAERQLACRADAAAPAPTAPANPATRTLPARAATPAVPAAPAPPELELARWAVDGVDEFTLLYALDHDEVLYVTCLRGEPVVLFEVLSGPYFGRAFDVGLGAFARTLQRAPYEGPVELLVEDGDPRMGFVALELSVDAGIPILVEAVFPDGTREPMLAVEGGEAFYEAYRWLPCAGW